MYDLTVDLMLYLPITSLAPNWMTGNLKLKLNAVHLDICLTVGNSPVRSMPRDCAHGVARP